VPPRPVRSVAPRVLATLIHEPARLSPRLRSCRACSGNQPVGNLVYLLDPCLLPLLGPSLVHDLVLVRSRVVQLSFGNLDFLSIYAAGCGYATSSSLWLVWRVTSAPVGSRQRRLRLLARPRGPRSCCLHARPGSVCHARATRLVWPALSAPVIDSPCDQSAFPVASRSCYGLSSAIARPRWPRSAAGRSPATELGSVHRCSAEYPRSLRLPPAPTGRPCSSRARCRVRQLIDWHRHDALVRVPPGCRWAAPRFPAGIEFRAGRYTARSGRWSVLVLVNPITCEAHCLCADCFPTDAGLTYWGYPIIDRGCPVRPDLSRAALGRRLPDAALADRGLSAIAAGPGRMPTLTQGPLVLASTYRVKEKIPG